MLHHSEKVPKAMAETFAAVTAITDAFCRKHLNDEYATLLRCTAAALCRKRPPPLATGTPLSWAAAITHAIGRMNFLFDSSQTPYLSAEALYAGFGVSQSTVQAKSKKVRDLLRMDHWDTQWSLPSRLHDNPMAWMIQTPEGFILDARTLPRETQAILYQRGIIPYVHADGEPEQAPAAATGTPPPVHRP